MTATLTRPAGLTLGATLPDPHAAVPRPDPATRTRWLGAALTTLGALLVGLVLQVVLVSPLHLQRDQHVLRGDYRTALASGVAPVGQLQPDGALVPVGSAVAILQVPRLGTDLVVLEGTTSGVTLSGPGHRRDTVLPGQVGASVVMGRQGVAGGPFAHLGDLRRGDEIRTVTGQGEATYRVTDVRRTGDALPAPLAAGGGRLTLVSASGTRYLPDDVVRVDADLVTPAFLTPVTVTRTAELAPAERAFAGDPTAWPWLVVALGALALAAVAVAVLRSWWGRWQTWVVGTPVLLLLGLLAGQQVLVLLPNLL